MPNDNLNGMKNGNEKNSFQKSQQNIGINAKMHKNVKKKIELSKMAKTKNFD